MKDEPAPINNETLPIGREDAIPCWQFNSYIAMDRYGSVGGAVSQVWATRRILYRSCPRQKGHTSGTRSIGVLYKTEAEAWDACIHEVQEMYENKIAQLRQAAEAAEAAREGGE